MGETRHLTDEFQLIVCVYALHFHYILVCAVLTPTQKNTSPPLPDCISPDLNALAQVVVTTVLQAACLAVAYTFPTAAEKIFAITGCTAVCIVCYCVPVFIHLQLKSRWAHAHFLSDFRLLTSAPGPSALIESLS